MKRNFFAAIMVLVAALTLFLTGSTALAGIQVIDFDNGNVDDWSPIEGDWTVEDDSYEVMHDGYARTMFGSMDWVDYTLEVDYTAVEHVNNDAGGFLIRADEDGQNAWRFWIRTDAGGRAQLTKWQDAGWVEPNLTFPMPIVVEQTYHLKFVAEGNQLQGFVDGELIGEHEDAEGFRKNGRMGLITHTAHGSFDNLIITGDVIPNAAVSSADKIATCWAKIKAVR